MTGKELGLSAVKGHLVAGSELSSLLGVNIRWVEKHMKDGTFPMKWYFIGERIRAVDSADLDNWLEKISVPAGTAPLPKKARMESA